ncbi:MAG: HAMP domain-containing protein [Candidatus Hydrogenedentes bacterium]|nr:HAMP domain-containing protein [Candidatus Hydrogenedentota bacterium]
MNFHFLARLRSFRIRIALLSTLLSGAVLLAFVLWTWGVVQRANLRRIDQTIRELVERPLRAPRGPQHWERVAESLEFVLGDLDDNPFVLLAIGRDGNVLHSSKNWPAELPVDGFPTPVEAGFVEPPARRGPPEGTPPRRGPPPPVRTSPLSFFTAAVGGQQWRIGVMGNPETTVVLGLNLAPYAAEMERLRRLLLVAVPAALVLIALGGWFLAERALRPVQALTRTAEGITAPGLDRRIPTRLEDAEFDRLIRVFNRMLDRLERSFHQAVRFSADAAHELKTPLTILQGELAQAVQGAVPGSEQQQTLSRLLEEVQRLIAITRKLLLLSLADSGQLKPQMEPINISEMLEAAGEDVQIVAPQLRVEPKIEPSLWVRADPDLLRQVVQNLTNNCVKYNVPGGRVAIELRKARDYVLLIVGNAGPGIPASERERVFERFYRADKAHNRRVDGVGLGLSLAREIVRAHHGELALGESGDGWTEFVVVLPAIVAPAGGCSRSEGPEGIAMA